MLGEWTGQAPLEGVTTQLRERPVMVANGATESPFPRITHRGEAALPVAGWVLRSSLH